MFERKNSGWPSSPFAHLLRASRSTDSCHQHAADICRHLLASSQLFLTLAPDLPIIGPDWTQGSLAYSRTLPVLLMFVLSSETAMTAVNILVLAALLCLPIILASAQQSTSPTSQEQLLSGFVRAARGENITYRSFQPNVKDALLTRCTDGKQAIEWETEEMPTGAQPVFATYAWIAGYSSGTSSAEATFRLAINGTEWFSFTTIKKRPLREWTLKGKDGAELSFVTKLEDSANDLFGYMFLKVPVRDFQQGQPLTISVVGDSANRKDWYMTFKYRLKDSLSVQPQPALLRTPAGQRQPIALQIEYSQRSGSADITLPGQERHRAKLGLGLNNVQLSVPAVKEPRKLELTIAVAGQPVRQVGTVIEPVAYREFWLLPHSHNDIGYSDLQADVVKKQLKNLRDAMRLCRTTASYPKNARFKWNSEILWAVDSFLTTCTRKEREEFIALVKEGGIELNGLYANELTGLCRPEELLRLTDFARKLEKTYGIEIKDAMITDIPGYTWATVPALVQGGIKYFSSGPNYVPTLPDEGDRVGRFNRAWGDKPFYWIAPSGQEKLLFWVAAKGYSWFHAWIAGQAGENTAGHLFDYLLELDQKKYPYDMVQLRYTIIADNGPTDPKLPDFVKSWNAQYDSPKVVIATAGEMFEEFERRWGDKIPSHAGDITPYWEDGALSTLRELGMVRRASERLVQAEVLSAIDGKKAIDQKGLDDAWKNVLLFDEHTWGAYNSVSEPDSPFAVSQWQVKQRFALDAREESERLVSSRLSSVTGGNVVDVINTSSWNRTDLVVLPAGERRAGDAVVDALGTSVPSQRLSDGGLAFVAKDVPPFGARRFFLNAGNAVAAGMVKVDETGLENGLVSLKLDPQTGALRSLKTSTGVELADTSVLRGLNQYCYVPGRDPGGVRTNRVKHVEIKEGGPLVGTLRVISEAPGCKSLVQEVTLVDGLVKVQLVNSLDKSLVRDKESVHFAFPLRVSGGAFHLDGGWGVVRPMTDQLPGSCMDFLSTGRWLDVSNGTLGVTWTTEESPLVEIGGMTDERPAASGYRAWRDSIGPGTLFYSYAMNNYWHTNYAAGQEGPSTLTYALFPHGAFDAGDAYRCGVEQSQPLLVRQATDRDAYPASLFTVSSAQVTVSSVLPSRDGKALIVRLFNTDFEPREFAITWGSFKPKRVFVSSLQEPRGNEAGKTFLLPSFGILTLRCEQ
jgi:alpha-mannosidase